MEVLGAAAVKSLLQQVLHAHHGGVSKLDALLLEAVHSKWVAGMPWLQRKWRVTNRLQHLVIQPQQQQAWQQQQAQGEASSTAAVEHTQVPIVLRHPSHECLRLWAELHAAADAGDWQLFMQHQQRLVELRPGWAKYPLYAFARTWRRHRGYVGTAGLCALLLEAWWAGQQQPAGPARAREMADAVVASVQAWEDQRVGMSGSGCGN
jgi:hypothetical protein